MRANFGNVDRFDRIIPIPISKELEITWNTQSADTKVSITGTMEYSNDGEATWSEITGPTQVLALGTGPYTLRETVALGAVTRCAFDDVTGSDGFNGAMTVEGGSNLGTTYNMFYPMDKLVSLDLAGIDTSGVTNMFHMFYGCSGLTTLDVSSFDTAQVTTMSGMFYGCSGLTALDLSSFDTAQVTTMSGVFMNCSGLTTLDLSSFDTAQVTNMSSMFMNCPGIIDPNISVFDYTSCTDISTMFSGCTNMTNITAPAPGKAFTNSVAFLKDCSSLETANLQGWDLSGDTFGSSHHMFNGAFTATGVLDVSGWTFPPDSSYAFENFNGAEIILSGVDTTLNTTTFGMFSGCVNLTSLDLTSFDTSITTMFRSMFLDCTSLVCITNLDTTNGTNRTNMFNNTPLLLNPDATAQADITDTDGANWVNPGTCP